MEPTIFGPGHVLEEGSKVKGALPKGHGGLAGVAARSSEPKPAAARTVSFLSFPACTVWSLVTPDPLLAVLSKNWRWRKLNGQNEIGSG